MARIAGQNTDALYWEDPIGWLRLQVSLHGLDGVFDTTGGYGARASSIYQGWVVDTEDPEQRGRVRVQIPGIGHRSADMAPGDVWAWPLGATVGGSNQLHGVFWPYDEGDQVFVAFLHDEREMPIVLGGFLRTDDQFNGTGDSYTDTSTEGNHIRTADGHKKAIRTRTGHTIEFDDDAGTVIITRGDAGAPSGEVITLKDETVSIVTEEGASVVLDAEVVQSTAPDGSFTRVGQNACEMQNAAGTTVKIDGPNIVMKAAGDINMDAGKTINVTGSWVTIGRGALEPAVTGSTFAEMWQTHFHPWAPAVTAPVAAPNFILAPARGLSTTVRIAK